MRFKNSESERVYKLMRKHGIKYSAVVKKLAGKKTIENYDYEIQVVFNYLQKLVPDENIIKAIDALVASKLRKDRLGKQLI